MPIHSKNQKSTIILNFINDKNSIQDIFNEINVSFVCFFSSRRRHTRLVSDWSSDVCSSDLMRRHTRLVSDWSSDVCSSDPSELQSLTNLVCRLLLSSEERRVGKECRSRWSPFLLKKKGRGVGGRGR